VTFMCVRVFRMTYRVTLRRSARTNLTFNMHVTTCVLEVKDHANFKCIKDDIHKQRYQNPQTHKPHIQYASHTTLHL
jgi:hypothetical protein